MPLICAQAESTVEMVQLMSLPDHEVAGLLLILHWPLMTHFIFSFFVLVVLYHHFFISVLEIFYRKSHLHSYSSHNSTLQRNLFFSLLLHSTVLDHTLV